MANHLRVRSTTTLSSFYKPAVSTLQPCLFQTIKMYCQSKEDSIGERARSTAEEFTRVAKEKAEKVTETVKTTLEDVKKSAVGEFEAESAKKQCKKTIEKGKYNKMGKD